MPSGVTWAVYLVLKPGRPPMICWEWEKGISKLASFSVNLLPIAALFMVFNLSNQYAIIATIWKPTLLQLNPTERLCHRILLQAYALGQTHRIGSFEVRRRLLLERVTRVVSWHRVIGDHLLLVTMQTEVQGTNESEKFYKWLWLALCTIQSDRLNCKESIKTGLRVYIDLPFDFY